MFVLVILNKGFKRKCHFNRFILFCFSSSDQVFFQQSGNICDIWKREYLGTFVRILYILDKWLIRTEVVSSFPPKLSSCEHFIQCSFLIDTTYLLALC